jgi:hypothetical protein
MGNRKVKRVGFSNIKWENPLEQSNLASRNRDSQENLRYKASSTKEWDIRRSIRT